MAKISGIDASRVASIDAGRAVSRPSDAAGGPSEGATENATGSVQITGTARNLARLEQTIRDLPVVDEARVGHIRNQIEQGTYSVRPQHVADQLLSLERALRSLPDTADGEPGEDAPAQPGS
ncbi:MAG: flagellar biosynthesis anti-sigma factor FlgM [Sinobacteraceae bacterium]|nr:flagellar biosynthesis anti-sigma factor FlgM [Nevskiaceae bacterium]MBV8852475.1 flagellar biosynthesis anti-sigma factor FlgM [Nevskiaceae bacterium]